MFKRFLAFALAMCMCLGMATVASATEVNHNPMIAETEVWKMTTVDGEEMAPYGGGTETWGASEGFVHVGSFTMEGNNLTPVKTMGVKGKLYLKLNDVHPVGSTDNINLRVQIRDASTQAVLKQWTINDFWGVANRELSGYLEVKQGQKVQISFRAYDADSGQYIDSKQVYVSYSYKLQ